MKRHAFAAIALLSFATPGFAAAQRDVDALVGVPEPGRYFVESDRAFVGANGWDQAQTFTATLTGGLSRIDLQAYTRGSADNFTLAIYSGNVAEGAPTLLGSASFSSGLTRDEFLDGGVISVDLSAAGIAVQAGSLYSYKVTSIHQGAPYGGGLAFAIGTNAGYGGDWDDPSPIDEVLNDYAGGRSYHERYYGGVSLGWTLDYYATDAGFATYVDVAPVPEPGEWAMMGAGLLVAGIAARRRRHA